MALKRIVFLDIDGPLIPAGAFFLDRNASYKRTFCEIPLALLRHLLDCTNAKLVTNSTHNFQETTGRSLKDDLIARGIDEDSFYPGDGMWRTQFGEPWNNRDERRTCIEQWLATAQRLSPKDTFEWIAIDDDVFTQDERLVKVDFAHGLTVRELHIALRLFQCSSKEVSRVLALIS